MSIEDRPTSDSRGLNVLADSQLTHAHIENFFKNTQKNEERIDHISPASHLTTDEMENFFLRTKISESKQTEEDSNEQSSLTQTELEGFFRKINAKNTHPRGAECSYSDCLSYDQSVVSQNDDYTFAALTTEIEDDPTIEDSEVISRDFVETENDSTGWPEELRWQRKKDASSPRSTESRSNTTDEPQHGFDQL